MKTIYQPTEEELKEMGFGVGYFGKDHEPNYDLELYKLQDDEKYPDRFTMSFKNRLCYNPKEKEWTLGFGVVLSPTSKQKVLDFISLFTQ